MPEETNIDTRKRVLFVDDEPNILSGLRRSLRGMRQQWSMTFAVGGEEGLRQLNDHDFDVIVTDMRMPGIDGGALLRHAQQHRPHMLRLVLSGHTEQSATFEVVRTAHQFLQKPTEGSALRRAIERAALLHKLVDDSRMRALVGGLDTLPTPPTVYRELTAELATDEPDLRKLGAIVQRDAGISAKVLQLTNSAFFGVPRKLYSVKDAAAYLGINTLQGLVLSVGAIRALKGEEQIREFDPVAEQHFAISAASIARQVCPSGRHAEHGYLAALMHSIGKHVLSLRQPETYARVLRESGQSDPTLAQTEQRLMGFTHAQVGAYLLALWGLPEEVVEAVAHHLNPGETHPAEFDALATCHVAVNLTHLQQGQDPQIVESLLDLEHLEHVGAGAKLAGWLNLARTA